MSEIENKEPEEFKPAFTPSEIGIEVGEPVGGFERETLDDAFEALSDERYVVFGHGTNHEPTLIMSEMNFYICLGVM
ncbi:hypothetical protein FACS189431_8040 [Alphaproteobacteria bacterium]|nr:hypothetical protein FACS189431_8040 [Alphaproteobacteria bacterium]